MSTLAYAALTARREDSDPNTSSSSQSPGVSSYVDIFAALVPAEVLAANAAILTFTTMTTHSANGGPVTITNPDTLRIAFYALVIISAGLYIVAHWTHWDPLDFIRMLIPPLAFIGWTMVQQPTAFDTVYPGLAQANRLAIAVIGALILSGLAGLLAYRADQQVPKKTQAAVPTKKS